MLRPLKATPSSPTSEKKRPSGYRLVLHNSKLCGLECINVPNDSLMPWHAFSLCKSSDCSRHAIVLVAFPNPYTSPPSRAVSFCCQNGCLVLDVFRSKIPLVHRDEKVLLEMAFSNGREVQYVLTKIELASSENVWNSAFSLHASRQALFFYDLPSIQQLQHGSRVIFWAAPRHFSHICKKGCVSLLFRNYDIWLNERQRLSAPPLLWGCGLWGWKWAGLGVGCLEEEAMTGRRRRF